MPCSRLRSAVLAIALALFALAPALAATPTITSFTPTAGTIGTKVTITGTSFTGATAVKLNGVATTYTVASATSITATVPATASTGKLAVATSGGTATSSASFTMQPGMQLSVSRGRPGTSLTVQGAGFHATTAVDLYLDSTDLALVVTTPTGTLSATVSIPASAQPGAHWITFVERGTDLAAQKTFTVDTDWALPGWAASNLGVNPYENTIGASNVDYLQEVWGQGFSDYGNAAPLLVVNGDAIFIDLDSTARAYSSSGTLLWSAATGGGFISSPFTPVASQGLVFFALPNDTVVAYGVSCRTDGGACTPTWSTTLTTSITAGLSVYKGKLYVPGNDNAIHVLNTLTGAEGAPITSPFYSQPASTPLSISADGTYAFGSGNSVTLYHTNGGTNGSSYSATPSPIAVADQSAFLTTGDGMLHRVGWWDVTVASSCEDVAPVIVQNQIIAGCNTTLGAYNPKTGATLWTVTTGGAISGAVAANGVLYVCAGGAIEAYTSTAPTQLWNGGFCSGSIRVSNGAVYSTGNGSIVVYGLPLAPDARAGAALGHSAAPNPLALHPNLMLEPRRSEPVTATVASE